MQWALYRKWRPQTFLEVCGQEHITSVLQYEVAQNKTTHAYLFCGSRGTGKTTCAKILAKAVNCLSPVEGNPCGKCAACRAIEDGTATDVLEMDAASNTGVDYIRDIREEVSYTPAMLKSRVYIIDEVHMLSGSAFNAMLKTLEEPPSQVIFILATTELQKIPTTILSRCKRFDFRRISNSVISERLLHIAKEEGLSLSEEAAGAIARLSQGGMRDAISLLELCAGSGTEITYETVMERAGAGGREAVLATVDAISRQDFAAVFAQIDSIYHSSKDIAVFWQELIGAYRDLLVLKHTKNPMEYLDVTVAELEQLKALAERFSTPLLLYQSKCLDDTLQALQRNPAGRRQTAEMALLRLSEPSLSVSVESLLARVQALEDQLLLGGAIAATPTPAPKPQVQPTPLQQTPKAPQRPTPQALKKEVPAPAANRAQSMPIANWAELVEIISRLDHGAASILAKTKAAFSEAEQRMYLTVTNTFEKMMVDRADVRALVSEVVKKKAQCEWATPEKIVITVQSAPTDAPRTLPEEFGTF